MTLFASSTQTRSPAEQPLGGIDPAPGPRTSTTERSAFRRDIQGLRAVAVLAVVLSHAGVAGFAGGYVGVDVFFVISGFLITDHLLRELGATGTIRLRRFYARRIRRLLPAAAAVIAVSGVVTYLFESSLATRNLARDALWALANAMNLKLSIDGTDYFAAEAAPSTLQHFWSLAVEEQFYLVWPLLMLLASGALVARRPGFSRRGVAISLSIVLVVSLALSVWQTTVAAPWAYFGLHTRAWELAAGALVALALPSLYRMPAVLGAALSWFGITCVAAAVLLFDESTPFPGYAAVLPVLGAVLVVVGGCTGASSGAERLLGTAPLQGIGAVSYSWYLWHWPVLILMPAILGWESTPLNNVFVVFVALLLSIIGYTNVEMPVRRARWAASTGRGLLIGLVLTSVLAVAATGVLVSLPASVGSGSPVTLAPGDISAVRESVDLTAAPANLTPAVEYAPDDVPASRANQCHLQLLEAQVKRPCDYGDPNGSEVMMLFGDSHADAWLPALDEIATTNRYHLFARTKAACPAVDMVVRDGNLGREYTECSDWRDEVMAEIAEIAPDIVVISGSYGVGNQSAADWGRATTNTVSALVEQGITVVFIADTPRRPNDETGPDCVAANLNDLSACVTPQEVAQPFHQISEVMSQSVVRSGGLVVDPTNWFCADGQCPAVIGNYLVYRDQSHVTATYMLFIAPELERLLPLG